MCELMGMSANVPTDICFSFTGLMQRGGELAHTLMVGGSPFMLAKALVLSMTPNQVLTLKLLS